VQAIATDYALAQTSEGLNINNNQKLGMSPAMIERYCKLANKQQSALAAILQLDHFRGGRKAG
jgi:hypothetical protein